MLTRPDPGSLALLRHSLQPGTESSEASSPPLGSPPSQFSERESTPPSSTAPQDPTPATGEQDMMTGFTFNLRPRDVADKRPVNDDWSSQESSGDEFEIEKYEENSKRKKKLKASVSLHSLRGAESPQWQNNASSASDDAAGYSGAVGGYSDDEDPWNLKTTARRRTGAPLEFKLKCPWPGCSQGRNNGFSTPGHLARHKRIHTGEKDFECDYPGCQAAFARRDNLTQHRKSHQSDKDGKRRHKRNPSTRSISSVRSNATDHQLIDSNYISSFAPDAFSFDFTFENDRYQQLRRERVEPTRSSSYERQLLSLAMENRRLQDTVDAQSAYQDGLRRDSSSHPPVFLPNAFGVPGETMFDPHQQYRRTVPDAHPYFAQYPPTPPRQSFSSFADSPLQRYRDASPGRYRAPSDGSRASRSFAPYARAEYESASSPRRRPNYTSLADQFSDGLPSPASSRSRSFSTGSSIGSSPYSPAYSVNSLPPSPISNYSGSFGTSFPNASLFPSPPGGTFSHDPSHSSDHSQKMDHIFAESPTLPLASLSISEAPRGDQQSPHSATEDAPLFLPISPPSSMQLPPTPNSAVDRPRFSMGPHIFSRSPPAISPEEPNHLPPSPPETSSSSISLGLLFEQPNESPTNYRSFSLSGRNQLPSTYPLPHDRPIQPPPTFAHNPAQWQAGALENGTKPPPPFGRTLSGHFHTPAPTYPFQNVSPGLGSPFSFGPSP